MIPSENCSPATPKPTAFAPAPCANPGSSDLCPLDAIFEVRSLKCEAQSSKCFPHCNIPNHSQAATELSCRSADILVRRKSERGRGSNQLWYQTVFGGCCGQECPRSGPGCGSPALWLC